MVFKIGGSQLIKCLNISGWNQFENVNIEFHPRVTILTGANGSGKSTLMRLISKELGWSYQETAVPADSSKLKSKFISGLEIEKLLNFIQVKKNNPKNYEEEHYMISDDNIQIGEIILESGKYNIFVPDETYGASYSTLTDFEGENTLKGVSIISHRQPYSYIEVDYIPVKAHSKGEAYESYIDSLRKRLLSSYVYIDNNTNVFSPVYHMKASIMSLAVFGVGNDHVTSDKESYRILEGFVQVLRTLLPDNIGFQDIKVTRGEVILKTKTGNFLIDAVSGGIGSIIDLAWQIYMFDNNDPYDSNNTSFVVLIDEIENHLHPSMQREILPKLIKAFPTAQFIVTTHSPFVVNSVSDSSVYALKFNDNNKVDSYKLDFYDKASNALGILRDILGVPVTLPVWMEEQLNNIINRYRNIDLTAETYMNLKRDLNELGLDEHMPQAIGLLQGGANS